MTAEKILHPCCNTCEFHSRIIFNLMKSIAAKNMLLNQKIEIISKRTTREKLMAYLMIQAKRMAVALPFHMTGRSLRIFSKLTGADCSAEISKLRKENVIECKRSFFRFFVNSI